MLSHQFFRARGAVRTGFTPAASAGSQAGRSKLEEERRESALAAIHVAGVTVVEPGGGTSVTSLV